MRISAIAMIVAASILACATQAYAAAPKLEIKSATFEATDGGGKADVTAKLKAMIQDGRLVLDVKNDILGGDPAEGHVKRLKIEYTLDGKAQTLEAGEGDHVEFPPAAPLTPAEQTERAMEVLKAADATQKQKADACRILARTGTKDAVPALAALLADEKLTHMARYGLETIPDPSVDDALRAALGKLKGLPLVGVIGSIGVRKDAKAVEPLTKFLADADADVAQAAARALGKIGTPEAAKAISGALAATAAANQLAFCEGLLRCAEAMAAKDQKADAQAIYDDLRKLKAAPHQVRTGSLRGAILMRGKDGLPMLVEAVRGDDFLLTEAAARTAMEMGGADVATALAAELAKLTADKQVLVLQTLGQIGDAAAVPAVSALAKAGDKPVRVEALRTLGRLGKDTVAPLMIQIAADADKDVAQAAKDCLVSLKGPAADEAVSALMKDSDAKTRLMAVDLMGQRRAAGAVPALLKGAEDSDEGVRAASLKVLGDVGGAAEVPTVLGLLAKAKSPAEMQAAEGALAAICLREADREACAAKVVAALGEAKGPTRLALVRVLGAAGGAKGLDALRVAAKDSDAEVKDTAVRALCEWPTADAMPDVAQLAKNSTDAKVKVLALRGTIRLVGLQEVAAEKKLATLKEAMGLAERKDEQRLVLAALGNLPSADALAMVVPQIGSQDLNEEACLAAVAIADKIVGASPGPVAEAMTKVTQESKNQQVGARAREILGKAKVAKK